MRSFPHRSSSAGKAVVEIPVTPYPDSQAEPAEVVQATIQPGSDYALAGSVTAQLAIADRCRKFPWRPWSRWR